MLVKCWPNIAHWDTIAAASPAATFYHTRYWHDIVVSAYNEYKIATREFIFDDGAIAVLPCLSSTKKSLFKERVRLKSAVFGTYGDIISNKPLTEEQRSQIYAYLKKLNIGITIEGNPFSQSGMTDFFERQECFTQIVNIKGDEAIIKKGFDVGAKRRLNQALKGGVIVRTIGSAEEVKVYYNIYLDCIKRWGQNTIFQYLEPIFHAIFNQDSRFRKIWLEEKVGVIIGGVIVFYWNRIACSWHNASLQTYFDCAPNNILQMEIMKDAFKNNFLFYDLGISGGKEGVVAFKKSLGAEMVEFISGRSRGQ